MEKRNVVLNIVAGCYERTVLGYELIENTEENIFHLEPHFTDNSHIGCIKTIAANSTFVASGSTDETIHLYNLDNNKDVGSLMQHDGSITSLSFHKDAHMISSGTDGTVCIWNTTSWECMKILKGHKEAVVAVAVHPSGKLALTAGKDKTLRTWNLITGRPAYTTHIKEVADLLLWGPEGDVYIVISDRKMNVYNITTATITRTYTCDERIHSAVFVSKSCVAVGSESNYVKVYNLEDPSEQPILSFEAHSNRIKGLACTQDNSSDPDDNVRWVVSVSSDGFIKVWKLNIRKFCQPNLLAEVKTQARLICVAVKGQQEVTGGDQTKENKGTKRLQERGKKDHGKKKKKKSGP